jgi:hypothetical protein
MTSELQPKYNNNIAKGISENPTVLAFFVTEVLKKGFYCVRFAKHTISNNA